MYERPDVPKPGRHRTAVAVAVLVAIGCALLAGLPALWRLANETNASTLADGGLREAVASRDNTLAVPDGAEPTRPY